jgi:phage terminase Nu1 subunit (DNA packaging protein)
MEKKVVVLTHSARTLVLTLSSIPVSFNKRFETFVLSYHCVGEFLDLRIQT